jgi:hypothetical protein
MSIAYAETSGFGFIRVLSTVEFEGLDGGTIKMLGSRCIYFYLNENFIKFSLLNLDK